MTMFSSETAPTVDEIYSVDEIYWAGDDAAVPVLLIDEATEAITAALYQVRCGSVLDDRDLAAAATALGDLFGGLGQLADELTTSVSQHVAIDQPHVERLTERLESVRAMTVSAQLVTDGLRLDSASIRSDEAQDTVPAQRR